MPRALPPVEVVWPTPRREGGVNGGAIYAIFGQGEDPRFLPDALVTGSLSDDRTRTAYAARGRMWWQRTGQSPLRSKRRATRRPG